MVIVLTVLLRNVASDPLFWYLQSFLLTITCSVLLDLRFNELHVQNINMRQTRINKDRGTIWEQDRSKRNAQQINRREKREWTIQRHRHHWVFAHSVYLFGVSLCSVLFPMEPVSLCCPFMFAPSGYLFRVSLCSVLFPMVAGLHRFYCTVLLLNSIHIV
jgi:hypothetical protein